MTKETSPNIGDRRILDLPVEAIAILRNHLELALSEITELLNEEIRLRAHIELSPVGEKAQDLTYKDQLYGRILQADNKLIISPVESLRIRADDKAIVNFLKPRVLDTLKEKHGLDYLMEESEGLLRSITIKGSLDAKAVRELKNACGWTFDKASNRPEPKES